MICKQFKDKKLSMLGMGNMRLPTKEVNGEKVIDWEKGREIIDYAYSHGINYFDTAFRYHGGESELFIGDAFLTKYEGVFEFVQIQLNYLDAKLQDAMQKYKVIYEKHGLPVIVMEPVRGGRLINLPEASAQKLEAAAPGKTTASWAFRYFNNLPGVAVVLSGMTEMAQIVENMDIFSKEAPLSESELAVLGEIVDDMLKMVPCTGCRYCTEECPMGLDIPKLIALYNEEKNGGSMLAFNMDTAKPEEDPSRCVGCGACSGICPQNIDVPSIMQEFAEILNGKKS